MTVPCSPDHPCAAVQLLTQKVVDLEADGVEIKKEVKSLYNRLPIWATATAWFMGLIIGVLSTLVALGG